MKTNLLSILLFSVTFSFSQVVIMDQSTPATLVQGSNYTASFTYTSTVDVPMYQIQLYNTLPNGDIDYTTGDSVDIYLGNYYTGNAPEPFPAGTVLPATATPSTITFNGSVRNDLPEGGNYKWLVKLAPNTGNDTGAAFGEQVQVTVTAPLATDNFSINTDEMYVSHELKSLVINTSNVKSNSATIYDMLGKKIISIDNLKEQTSFDFSSLGNGVFILFTNDNRKLKFIL